MIKKSATQTGNSALEILHNRKACHFCLQLDPDPLLQMLQAVLQQQLNFQQYSCIRFVIVSMHPRRRLSTLITFSTQMFTLFWMKTLTHKIIDVQWYRVIIQ